MTGSKSGPSWWYLRFKERKGFARTKPTEAKVVGVTYENRQAVVADLAMNEQVLLRREPNNLHDKHAIAVCRQNGQQIGYLAREHASLLAASFDRLGKPLPAVVTAIIGKGYADRALGVRISFTPPEATPVPLAVDADPDEFEEL